MPSEHAATLAANPDYADCTVMLPGANNLEPLVAFSRTTVRLPLLLVHAFFSGFCFIRTTLIPRLFLLRNDAHARSKLGPCFTTPRFL